MALAKRERLKSRSVFRNLSELEKVWQSRNFTVLADKKTSASAVPPGGTLNKNDRSQKVPLGGFRGFKAVSTQYAFVIGKKECRKATGRNRIRRRFIEAFRKIRTPYSGELSNYAYIIYLLRNSINQLSHKELTQEIEKFLNTLPATID